MTEQSLREDLPPPDADAAGQRSPSASESSELTSQAVSGVVVSGLQNTLARIAINSPGSLGGQVGAQMIAAAFTGLEEDKHQLRDEVQTLRSEVSSLKGEKSDLTAELAVEKQKNTSLRSQVGVRLVAATLGGALIGAISPINSEMGLTAAIVTGGLSAALLGLGLWPRQ
jgi:hypothetical protein